MLLLLRNTEPNSKCFKQQGNVFPHRSEKSGRAGLSDTVPQQCPEDKFTLLLCLATFGVTFTFKSHSKRGMAILALFAQTWQNPEEKKGVFFQGLMFKSRKRALRSPVCFLSDGFASYPTPE